MIRCSSVQILISDCYNCAVHKKMTFFFKEMQIKIFGDKGAFMISATYSQQLGKAIWQNINLGNLYL